MCSEIKCEKCNKVITYVMVNYFDFEGADGFVKSELISHEGGAVTFIAKEKWTGYEQTDSEYESIECPFCRKFPFEDEEIFWDSYIEVAMFRKENKSDKYKKEKK